MGVAAPALPPEVQVPELSSVPKSAGLVTYLRLDARGTDRFAEIDTCLLICGDAEEGLDLLPEGSVQTAVTSPPYWSL